MPAGRRSAAPGPAGAVCSPGGESGSGAPRAAPGPRTAGPASDGEGVETGRAVAYGPDPDRTSCGRTRARTSRSPRPSSVPCATRVPSRPWSTSTGRGGEGPGRSGRRRSAAAGVRHPRPYPARRPPASAASLRTVPPGSSSFPVVTLREDDTLRPAPSPCSVVDVTLLIGKGVLGVLSEPWAPPAPGGAPAAGAHGRGGGPVVLSAAASGRTRPRATIRRTSRPDPARCSPRPTPSRTPPAAPSGSTPASRLPRSPVPGTRRPCVSRPRRRPPPPSPVVRRRGRGRGRMAAGATRPRRPTP